MAPVAAESFHPTKSTHQYEGARFPLPGRQAPRTGPTLLVSVSLSGSLVNILGRAGRGWPCGFPRAGSRSSTKSIRGVFPGKIPARVCLLKRATQHLGRSLSGAQTGAVTWRAAGRLQWGSPDTWRPVWMGSSELGQMAGDSWVPATSHRAARQVLLACPSHPLNAEKDF